MSSILTNNSAMNALSTLRSVNSNLNDTQTRISTGMKINSGKDNAAYFSISETMKGDSGMYKAIDESLTLTKNSVATARLGAETIEDLAQQFVERVAFAQSNAVDRGKVKSELQEIVKQMDTTLKQATFNGDSMIDGGASVTVVTGVTRSGGTFATTSIDITAANLSTEIGDLTAPATNTGADFFDIAENFDDDTVTLANKLVAAEGLLKGTIDDATSLGIAENAIENQQDFLKSLSETLDSGVGSMVDADMEEEAARLQSLQVQQQLATQSLSIANQAPQNILSLFR